MHTGATTTDSSNFLAFLSYAQPLETSSFAPTSFHIHSTDEIARQTTTEQLVHDLVGVMDDCGDSDDDMEVPQAMSASCFADPISSSPAAMFLSAFTSPKPAAPQLDEEGDVVSGYTLGPIIGHGAFSTIRQASSSSGDVVAVKIVRRSDRFKRGGDAAQSKKRIMHETQVWATLSHEHILPLFSAAHTAYADFFFTLYCPAGSLFDILKREGRPELPHDDAGMMFRQVVRGLRYLHEVAMLVHRDIKLENVLVDESGVCRIGDFGLTKRIGEPDEDEDEQMETFQVGHATVHRTVSLAVPSSRVGPKATSLHVQLARHRNSTSSARTPSPAIKFQPGSLPYAAPELLIPQAGLVVPHPAQDIWALGALLFALLTGRLPFTDSFEPRLHMKILNGTYEIPAGIGRGAERVLKGCLDRSDITRWDIAMVDEVAWGVGWGSEIDDVTPADSDEEFQIPPQARSRSRHRVEDTIPEEEWQQEEPHSRPSMDAASRRSSSRMQRSLSRGPLSARRPLPRSISRAPSPPPASAVSATAPIPVHPGSIARSPSSVRSPSSTRSSHFFDPTFEGLSTSASSFERGRRRQKFSQSSHSPSPSIAAPTTPSDSLGPDPDLGRSISRGRPRKVEFEINRRLRLHGVEHLYAAEELETLDEAPPAPAFSSMFVGRMGQRSQSKPAYDPARAYTASRYVSKRTESTPPDGEAWPKPLSGGLSLQGLGNFSTSLLLRPVKPITAVNRRVRSRSLDIVR